MVFFGFGSTLIDAHTLPGKLALARFSVQRRDFEGVQEWVDGWV